MIQAVLFDLGGTLLEYEPFNPRALFRQAAKNSYTFLSSQGCALPTFERYYRTQRRAMRWEKFKAALAGREIDSRKMLRKLCIDLRLQRDPGTTNLLGAQWYEPLARRARIAPDAIATLQQLRDSQMRLGIIANAPVPGEVIDEHLREIGLLPFFEVRVYSSEVGYRKPDEEIFREALKELDLPANHVAYVGDSPVDDAKGARRAGMIAILKAVNPGFFARRRAHHLIARLGELPALLGVGQVIEDSHPSRGFQAAGASTV